MFAPYCTTCGTRRLLGFSRIVASDWDSGGGITLRCICGSIVSERPGRATPATVEPGERSNRHIEADARPPTPLRRVS